MTPNKFNNSALNVKSTKESCNQSTEPFKNLTPQQKKKDVVTLKKPWTDIRNEDSDKKHLFDSKTPKKVSGIHNLRSSSKKNNDKSIDDEDDFDMEDPKDSFKTPKKWSRLKSKSSVKEFEN